MAESARGLAENHTTKHQHTMTAATVQELARKIQHPTEWEEAFPYFLQKTVHDPDFFHHGQKTSIPIILQMLSIIAGHGADESEIKLINPVMARHPEYHLIHGMAHVGPRVISFVYLTDIHQGVFDITDPVTETSERRSRCSALPLNQDPNDPQYQKIYTEDYNLHPN